MRYYWPGRSDQHTFSQRTRFLPERLLECFEQCVTDPLGDEDDDDDFAGGAGPDHQPQRPPADEGFVGYCDAEEGGVFHWGLVYSLPNIVDSARGEIRAMLEGPTPWLPTKLTLAKKRSFRSRVGESRLAVWWSRKVT